MNTDTELVRTLVSAWRPLTEGEHAVRADSLRPQPIAWLLYALVNAYPRPLCLWRLLTDGTRAQGLDGASTPYALLGAQGLRLTRLRHHSSYLFLTARGEDLTGQVIRHFNPLQ